MKILLALLLIASASLKASTPFQICHLKPINGVMVDDVNGYTPSTVGSLTYSTVDGRYAVSGFSVGNFLRGASGLRADWATAHSAWQIDFYEEILSLTGGTFVAWQGGFFGCSGATFFGIFGGGHPYGLELSNSTNCFDTTAGTPGINAWHKITISWDGSNKRYYVDNALVTTDSTSGNYGTTVSAIDIGAASDTPDGDQPFNGYISEITFWNGAFCATDPCTNPSPTNTPTFSNTPAGTLTNTPVQSATNTPTNTPSPTATPTPYLTFTPNVSITPAAPNGLGLTPIQWWDSFAAYDDNVTEAAITSSAQAMVNNGMYAAGYNYVVINEGWTAATRDGGGNITWDVTKFPDGMPFVATFVHSLGMKLMIYTSVPATTCSGFVGTGENNITADATTFASWGIDGVYVDQCTQGQLNVRTIYTKWWNALAATGRPMFLEASQYGEMNPELWAPAVSNSWRTHADSNDSFAAAIANWLSALAVSSYEKIGSFISIEISSANRGAQTLNQYRAAKTFNCMLPGTDLCNDNVTTISAAGLAILNNPYANRVLQDTLCDQAVLVQDFGAGGQVYMRKLKPSSKWAVELLNTDVVDITITITFATAIAQYNSLKGTNYSSFSVANVYDIWNGVTHANLKNSYSGVAPATSVNFSIVDSSIASGGPSKTQDKTRQ